MRGGPNTKKNLRFQSTMEILEFGIQLGDNPAAKDGPPIAMAATHDVKKVVYMQSYERQKMVAQHDQCKSNLSEDLSSNTTTDRLRVPSQVRYTRLLEAGYTIDEIKMATSQAQEIRKFREKSMSEKEMSRFQAAKMNSVKTIKSLASFRLFSPSQA